MKKFVQLAAGSAVMLMAAPHLYGTPFNHWMVFAALFVATMYGVAVLQAYAHWRFSNRGAATTTPGARVMGRPRTPAGI